MGKTKISWASYTVNVVTGCSKPAAAPQAAYDLDPEVFDELFPGGIPEKWRKPGTSPECVRCYAEDLSLRRKWSEAEWSEENEDRNVKLKPDRFREFVKVAVKPVNLPPSQRERFFVCSMGDLFHRNVPDHFLESLFAIISRLPHIYMLLTKRIDRAAAWPGPWPENIWLGTTCGHPITKWRIEYLRDSGAKTRFLSMEPLLASMLPINLAGIDQVIVGGESGSGFRPMKMEWARELRDAAAKAGAAFFYKQDAAYRTESRPWLVEADGSRKQYHQFPGELTSPVLVSPTGEPFEFPMV